MTKNILGIDLGTSSVKMLLLADGNIIKSKAAYDEKTPKGWLCAIKKAFESLKIYKIDAVSLSSQVGTYIINESDVLGWDLNIGKEELAFIKEKYTKETFIKELSMPHPDIFSYPLPRLMYIKKNYKDIKSICQPKDFICKALTGEYVTDKYSYRGLANTVTGKYSSFFLNELGISEDLLPIIISCDDIIGFVTDEGEKITGIPKNIPVYAGLNDFFASIKGMGISKEGEMFDITGTSEHIGIITDKLSPDTKMVSGVYFDKFIHYGVTASSGASIDFAIREFGICNIDIKECLKNNPPIFTPYLNGERAPIFDSNARGMFFGLNSKTSKEEMAYSVLEGVVFSLHHIYESMGKPPVSSIKVSGGASQNDTLNFLKAEMFSSKVSVLKESDTSALGAVLLAANTYENETVKTILPTGEFHEILHERYEIYKNLYNSLKNQFEKFANIRKDLIL